MSIKKLTAAEQHEIKVRENLITRVKIQKKLLEEPTFKDIQWELCKRDIVYFCEHYCWTYNPKKDIPNLPFVLYDFQKETLYELVRAVEEGYDVFIEKSREMGLSWLTVVLSAWGFLFHNWTGLLGSYKQDYVYKSGDMKALFQKIEYVLKALPSTFYNTNTETSISFMNISKKNQKEIGQISGDTGASFGTGDRRKFIVMDEFSYWENGETAFRKTRDTSKCRIIIGTPNGLLNTYGKIAMKIYPFNEIGKKIKKIRLHWSLHPEKTQEWYEDECSKRSKVDVAQELDIDYVASVGNTIYDTTNMMYNNGPDTNDYNEYSKDNQWVPVISMDFGLDMNCCIIGYYNKINQYLSITYSFQRKNRNLEAFISLLTGVRLQNFLYDTEYNDALDTKTDDEIIEKHSGFDHKDFLRKAMIFGDPFNSKQKKTNSSMTIEDLFRKNGIYLSYPKGNDKKTYIKQAQMQITKTIIQNGNNQNLILYESLSQWSYKSVKGENNNSEPIPRHDDNSHYGTSYYYLTDGITQLKPINTQMSAKPKTHTPPGARKIDQKNILKQF